MNPLTIKEVPSRFRRRSARPKTSSHSRRSGPSVLILSGRLKRSRRSISLLTLFREAVSSACGSVKPGHSRTMIAACATGGRSFAPTSNAKEAPTMAASTAPTLRRGIPAAPRRSSSGATDSPGSSAPTMWRSPAPRGSLTGKTEDRSGGQALSARTRSRPFRSGGC